MRRYYVARFRGARGRYLVTKRSGGYEGQRIATARQRRYGNKPEPVSGLYLYESWLMFGHDELVSLRLHCVDP